MAQVVLLHKLFWRDGPSIEALISGEGKRRRAFFQLPEDETADESNEDEGEYDDVLSWNVRAPDRGSLDFSALAEDHLLELSQVVFFHPAQALPLLLRRRLVDHVALEEMGVLDHCRHFVARLYVVSHVLESVLALADLEDDLVLFLNHVLVDDLAAPRLA